MPAAIGSLFIDLAMNTAAFASDLGKANQSLQSWASQSNRVLAGVVNGYRGLNKEISGFVSNAFTMRNVMGTLLGTAGLGLLVTKSLEAASAVVDVADNIGLTTKALQEYQFVAKLSNVGTEQLQRAFEKFAKDVGDAHAKTGSLYEFLKKTNVGLLNQVTSAKSLDEALNAVFIEMGKYANQQDRVALTSVAFGKANLNLVNMVKDGADAFDLARQRANELGLVIDDKLLRNAEDAGDKIDILSMVIKARLTTAVAENAVEIGNLAENIIDATPKIIAFATGVMKVVNVFLDWKVSFLSLQAIFEVFQTAMAVGLVQLGGYIAAWVKATIAGFSQVGSIIEAFGSDFADMVMHPFDNQGFTRMSAELDKGFTGAFKETFDKTISETDAFTKRLTEKMDENILQLRDRIEALKQKGATAMPESAGLGNSSLEGYAEKLREQAEAAEKAAAAFKKMQQEAKKVFDETRTPLEEYTLRLDKLNKMVDAGVISWETYQRAVKKAQDDIFKLGEAAQRVITENLNPQEQYNTKMAELNGLLKGGAIDWETYRRATEKANVELVKAQQEGTLWASIMDKAIDGNIRSWRDLAKAALDYSKTVLKALIEGQSLQSALGGGGGGGAFSGLGSLVSLFTGNSFSQTSGFLQYGGYGPFPSFHGGGVVGASGGTRRVHPAVFANAPRFHGGGLVGGEVPAILNRGERVQTEQEQRNQSAARSVVYNIDARGSDAGVEQRLRNMIMEVSNSIDGRAIKAVRDARFRDPGLFGSGNR